MTGFEYTAAVGMLQEGNEAEGQRCIEAIRVWYDGRRGSPFDEAVWSAGGAVVLGEWGGVGDV